MNDLSVFLENREVIHYGYVCRSYGKNLPPRHPIMKRFFKILLFTLCGLLLLTVAGTFALLTLVNSDQFKDQMSAKIHDLTKKDLTIRGDVSWTFFPHISLQFEDAILVDPQKKQAKPFATIGRGAIQLKIRPLIQGDIEVSEISLDNSQFNLVKNTKHQASAQNLEKIASQHSLGKIDGKIHKIIVTHSQVNLLNENHQPQTTFAIDQLRTSQINIADMSFKLNSQFSITHADSSMSAKVNIKTQVDIKPKTQYVMFNKLRLQGQLSYPGLGSNMMGLLIQGKLTYDHLTQTFTANLLQGEINNMSFQGDMIVKKFNEASGHFTVAEFNLVNFLNSIDQRTWGKENLPFEKVSGAFDFIGTKNSLSLKQVIGTIGNSQLKGEISFLKLSPIKTTFQLNIDSLNLNKFSGFSPLKTQNTTASTIQAKNKLQQKNTHSFITEGKLSVGKLSFSSMQATNVNANIRAAKGIVTISPMTANFYQGNYQGTIEADLRKETPLIKATKKITQMNLGEFLKDTTGRRQVTGTAQIKSQGTIQGTSVKQMLSSANGSASISVENGTIPSVDAINLVSTAYATYKHRKPTRQGNAPTTFSNLSANFTIKKGIAQNNNFLIKSPLLTATGKGKVNLASQKVNYKIEVSLFDSLVPQLMGFQNKAGGTIPFKVTGTLSKLNFEPDLPIMLRRITEQRLGKELGNVHKQLKKSGGDIGDIGDQLKSLFD